MLLGNENECSTINFSSATSFSLYNCFTTRPTHHMSFALLILQFVLTPSNIACKLLLCRKQFSRQFFPSIYSVWHNRQISRMIFGDLWFLSFLCFSVSCGNLCFCDLISFLISFVIYFLVRALIKLFSMFFNKILFF